MQYIVICIVFYLLVFLFDACPLFKKKDKKSIILYFVLFISTLTINIMIGLEIPILSPIEPLTNVVKWIWRLP